MSFFPAFPNSIVSNDIDFITAQDSSAYQSLTFIGRSAQEMPGNPSVDLVMADVYVFSMRFSDGSSVRLFADARFATVQAAAEEVSYFAGPLGKLPGVMRAELSHVVLNIGTHGAFAEADGRFFVVSTENMAVRRSENDMEETIFHEAVHASLDTAYLTSDAWRNAQVSDGIFITDYAESLPDKEDFAETALFAYTYLNHPLRLSSEIRQALEEEMPARLALLVDLFSTPGPGDGFGPRISGAEGPETLNGTAQSEVIVARGGADRLTGGLGDDTVFGDDGRDVILGQAGNDLMHGGADADRITGGTGDDVLLGNSGADRLFGQAGRDTLEGGDGNDYMKGDFDADHLIGGRGGDFLAGGAGNDSLDGGEGADRLFGGTGDDTLLGGQDNDWLIGFDGSDNLQGQSGDDILYGGGGDDSLSGGAGDDRMSGSDGNDSLNGQRGDDRMFGGVGADTMSGSDGFDYIKGGDGNDTIDGGAHADRLYGGTGADTFVFSPQWSADRIFDWTTEDQLDFSSLGLKSVGESDADAMANLTVFQSGAHVILHVSGDMEHRVELVSTDIATLTIDNFIF